MLSAVKGLNLNNSLYFSISKCQIKNTTYKIVYHKLTFNLNYNINKRTI